MDFIRLTHGSLDTATVESIEVNHVMYVYILGFTKAFGLAQPPQLQAAISRPMGILWLAAALLLIVSAGLVLLAVRWWWVPAALGVVLSQVLIFIAWNDAKAGTIANLILLFPIVVAALGAAPWSFRSLYNLVRPLAGRLAEYEASGQTMAEFMPRLLDALNDAALLR